MSTNTQRCGITRPHPYHSVDRGAFGRLNCPGVMSEEDRQWQHQLIYGYTECVAHGSTACALCTLNPADCARSAGGCETFADTGMHWDTCPNSVYEIRDDGAWLTRGGSVITPRSQADFRNPAAAPVRKLSYWQPLAPGICDTCGEPVHYNLAIGVVQHDVTDRSTCDNPFPALEAQAPQSRAENANRGGEPAGDEPFIVTSPSAGPCMAESRNPYGVSLSCERAHPHPGPHRDPDGGDWDQHPDGSGWIDERALDTEAGAPKASELVVPGGILKPARQLTEEELATFEAAWRKSTEGVVGVRVLVDDGPDEYGVWPTEWMKATPPPATARTWFLGDVKGQYHWNGPIPVTQAELDAILRDNPVPPDPADYTIATLLGYPVEITPDAPQRREALRNRPSDEPRTVVVETNSGGTELPDLLVSMLRRAVANRQPRARWWERAWRWLTRRAS